MSIIKNCNQYTNDLKAFLLSKALGHIFAQSLSSDVSPNALMSWYLHPLSNTAWKHLLAYVYCKPKDEKNHPPSKQEFTDRILLNTLLYASYYTTCCISWSISGWTKDRITKEKSFDSCATLFIRRRVYTKFEFLLRLPKMPHLSSSFRMFNVPNHILCHVVG